MIIFIRCKRLHMLQTIDYAANLQNILIWAKKKKIKMQKFLQE